VGSWADKLAEHLATKTTCPPSAGTDKTDEWGLLSVLAVPKEGVAAVFALESQAGADPADGGCAEQALVAWTDADISRFLSRRTRLLRWGWSEVEAEGLAERLVRRDREQDDRHACVECRHLEMSGRCGWARMGRIAGADRRLEPVPDVLQRCPSFMPIALATVSPER
jgi:hypothetical protein